MYNGIRVAAVMPLHYGVDYVAYAIRSVADIVDAYHIMYSPVPCQGARSTHLPNPDTREMLYNEILTSGEGHKCYWHEHDDYANEGDQVARGAAIASDCPIYIKLDSDEIHEPGSLAAAIQYGMDNQRRELRIPMIHHWRSLRRAIVHDPAAPGRIYFRMFPQGNEDTFSAGRITHLGYALPSDVVRYKMSIHGHASEFRKDCDWFEDVFMANRQVDCHPCGSEYWNAEDVLVPELLKEHPFAELDLIP